jgi:probable O-glycosylation ligase (exosortase A-associated)
VKGLLFTYALSYGGAVASLINPFVGLLIYICFAVINPESMWYWSIPQGNYSRIVAIGLLLGWAGHGFGKWDFGRGKAVVLSLVGFILWGTITSALAPHPEISWPHLEVLVKIALPFLVGMTLIDSVAKLRLTVWVLILSQGYIAYELNLAYLGGYNRMWLDGYGSLDNNGEAVAMNACIGMAMFLGMHEDRWWKKIVAFGMAGGMIHAVLISFSRGGMLALVVTGIVAFFLIQRRVIHYTVLAAVILVSISLTGKEARERFQTIFASESSRDGSAAERLRLEEACISAMWQYPLTGLGPDHWPIVAQEYGFPPGKQAHTTWLRVGAEMGIVGLLCYVMFYGLTTFGLWRIVRNQNEVSNPWIVYLAQAVIASVVGFAVSAQFVSAERVEGPYYVTLIGACAIKLCYRPRFAQPSGEGGCGPVG